MSSTTLFEYTHYFILCNAIKRKGKRQKNKKKQFLAAVKMIRAECDLTGG